MRKICSSSSLCALSGSGAPPAWPLGGAGDHHLLGVVGSCGAQQFLLHTPVLAAAAPAYHHHSHNVPPLLHKAAAADESVFWILQRHLQLMPSSYAEAGFSVEEMLHHIRIFKEMQNGRKLGLLITATRSKAGASCAVTKDAASTRRLLRVSNIDQPARQLFEVHFADHRVHSRSTALEALGLQQLVAEDHVQVKKVQVFQRSREGLGVLTIARIKMSAYSGNLQDSIKAAKGSLFKALQSCVSFPTSSKVSAEMCIRSSDGGTLIKPDAADAASTLACIDHRCDWTTGYAGGGFVNELLRRWWVNGDGLTLSREIGVGSSGAVYEGIFRGKNSKVAVKLIKKSHDSNFRRELLALGSLTSATAPAADHNVVQLMAACRNSQLGMSVMVTRYMEGGSLHNFLKKEPRLSNKRVFELAMDIAKGMLYLHSRGIVHMDLKSPNVFLDEGGRAVIGDLGCARAVNEKEPATIADTGTYRWMAPEAFGEEGGEVAATLMMDVYSYGMVLWELVSGEVPWAGKSPVQAAAGVVLQPELRPNIPTHCFPPFACLIRKCWAQNPAHRPTFAQILRMLRLISPPS